jgi:glycosyltransferase involved in cell wall biosynthesis
MTLPLGLSATSEAPILVCIGGYFRGGVSSGANVRLVLPWPVDADARDARSVTVLEHASDLDDPAICIRLPISRFDRLSTRPERQQALARSLSRYAANATIVLNNDWDLFGAIARLARDGLQMRVLSIAHSDDPLYYEVAGYYASLFAGTVAVSSTIARELRQRQIVGATGLSPLTVIPCGVDRPSLTSRVPFAGVLRLVTACRLEERQKRILDIPRIAAGLRAAGVPFLWTVLGGGPDREALVRAVRTHDVVDDVRLPGWRPHSEVLQEFLRSDVYVQTSAIEGTPVGVMEAMARSVVPVVTIISGTDELLGSAGERAGMALPCGDIAAFARALTLLHESPAQLAELSRRAERRALTVLSIEQTTAALLEFIRHLPEIDARWPSERDPAIPLERIGVPTARLDWLPNPVAVAARRLFGR